MLRIDDARTFSQSLGVASWQHVTRIAVAAALRGVPKQPNGAHEVVKRSVVHQARRWPSVDFAVLIHPTITLQLFLVFWHCALGGYESVLRCFASQISGRRQCLGSRLRLPQSVGLTCDAKLLDRSRQPSWVTGSVVELRGSGILSTLGTADTAFPKLAPGRRLRSSASRSSIVRISRG